jgi:hypothetical protein
MVFGRKRLLLATVSVVITIATVVTCFKVSEIYFFDKFYYNKFPELGYVKPIWNPLGNANNPPTIEHRIKDLRLVFSQSQDQRVLGISDQETPTYKILFIGDSMVYGNGVREPQRMSEILEKELNKVRPTKVYTLAQSGDSIIDNYYKFEKAEQVIQPNMSIFAMVVNDFLLDQTDKYPGEAEFYKQLRQECPQEEKGVTWTGPQMTIYETMDMNLLPSVDPNYANICYLEKILDRLAGKQVMFFSFSPLRDTNNDPAGSYERKGWEVMNAYASPIKKRGLYFTSTLGMPEYVFQPISTMEGHPSPKSHKEIGEYLAKVIMNDERWKFYVSKDSAK